MNVSQTADIEFMRLLEKEEPKRFASLMKNTRQDKPNSQMSEEQALTNFMLGYPTGQYRFEIVAGITAKNPAPTPIKIESGVAERRRVTQKRIKQARVARGRLRGINGKFLNSDTSGAKPSLLAA